MFGDQATNSEIDSKINFKVGSFFLQFFAVTLKY